LPEQAKDIYKRYAESSPTPNRGYQILDKDSAYIYVFNSQNDLVGKVVAGFGKDTGDEANTSNKYNEGKMTTPAGIFLISDFTTPEDLEEYGKLQFSLFGKSVLDDDIFLGEHQTYSKHGELEPRTKKLNTPSPEDNRFSNGCINIDQEDFKKYIASLFRGDYGEFFFVLQDKKGRESGVKFDVNSLIESIKPMMLEKANEQEKIYQELISKINVIKNRLNIEIKELEKGNNLEKEEILKQKRKDLKDAEDALKETSQKIAALKIRRAGINQKYGK